MDLIALYLYKLFKEGSEESTDLENSKCPIKTDITFLPDLQYKISPKKRFYKLKITNITVWDDFPTSVVRDTSKLWLSTYNHNSYLSFTTGYYPSEHIIPTYLKDVNKQILYNF